VISLEELAERRRAIAEQHHAAVQQRDQHRRTAEQRVRLTHVLSRIADHKITRIDELLPWRYAAAAS
jgi:hypothetical protein